MTLPLTDHLNPSNYFGLFHIGPSPGGDARATSRPSSKIRRHPFSISLGHGRTLS